MNFHQVTIRRNQHFSQTTRKPLKIQETLENKVFGTFANTERKSENATSIQWYLPYRQKDWNLWCVQMSKDHAEQPRPTVTGKTIQCVSTIRCAQKRVFPFCSDWWAQKTSTVKHIQHIQTTVILPIGKLRYSCRYNAQGTDLLG